MAYQFKSQLIPQPYSRVTTPAPSSQPFTPPPVQSFSNNPSTPSNARLKYLNANPNNMNRTLPGDSFYLNSNPNSFVNLKGAKSNDPISQNNNNNSNNNINNGNGTLSSSNYILPTDYQKPQVTHWLDVFETSLAQLVESISKFRPDMSKAEALVEAELELARAITQLTEDQKQARKIYQLRQVSKNLDEELNTLLITLADCRRTLRALPKPDEKFLKSLPDGVLDYTRELIQLHEQRSDSKDLFELVTEGINSGKTSETLQQQIQHGTQSNSLGGTNEDTINNINSDNKINKDGNLAKSVTLQEAIRRRRSSLAFSGKSLPDKPKVSANELLNYARKITKFTSAPLGYSPESRDNPAFNFPWPSEDELRRGVLALAATVGTIETNQGKASSSNDALADEKKPLEEGKEPTQQEDEKKTEDKQSNDNNNNNVMLGGGDNDSRMMDYRNDVIKPQPAAKIDLDLFDPDDDDDKDMEM